MDALTLNVHAATDRGRKRLSNEDSHAVWISDDPEERERRGVLLVVADGMGGLKAGGVASQMAVEAVVRDYTSGDASDPARLLRSALERANHVVHTEGKANAEHAGMGTTCTAVVVRARQAWVAHVGDSRAYLIRDGAIHPLTEDHSLVAAMVRRRELTPEQARSDLRRNVITRSIGVEESVEVDAGAVSAPLEPGDTLLLCSDGLHGLITDEELAELGSRLDLRSLSEELIGLANRRGGPDNITVVVARMERPGPAAPPASSGHEAAALPDLPDLPDPVDARAPVERTAAVVPGPSPSSRPAAAPPVPPRAAAPEARGAATPAASRNGHEATPDRSGLMMVLMLALILALVALLFVIGRRPPGP